MSKPSTSDIITKGEYLEPDFNPASLTVAHLLGILGYHNVKYPSQYTKPKLVQLFNDEITARAAQFQLERLSRQNSQASDEGIKDGITGQALNGGRRLTRGTSRRGSEQPAAAPLVDNPRPEPVKRRRSSTAEPQIVPTRRRRVKQSTEILAEESEPEEVAVRKVGRNRGEAEAGGEARRVARAIAKDDVDSGWEDNNIFQSGAESSSPVRPSPVKPRVRRSTAVPRKSKAMSVPPQFSPPSPSQEEPPRRVTRSRQSSVKPPESNFEPVLPSEATRETRASRTTGPKLELVPEASGRKPTEEVIESSDAEEHELGRDYEKPSSIAGPSRVHEEVPNARVTEDVIAEVDEDLIAEERPDLQSQEQEPDAISQATSDELAEDEQTRAVSQRIAEGGQLVRRKARSASATPSLLQFFLALFGVATLTSLYNYKQESSPIGFCETGTRSNRYLDDLRSRRAAVEECNNLNRTLLFADIRADTAQAADSPTPASISDETSSTGSELTESEECPPRPVFPQPDECAPCPAFASCTSNSVTCETGYLLRPHPLLFLLSVPQPHNARDSKAQNTYARTNTTELVSWGDYSVSQLIYSALSSAFDGLPGFGPIAFPPRCVEDPRRKRNIGALGKAVEAMLAAERGRRICAGVGWKEQPGTQAEEAKKWGVDVETLKEKLKRKTSPNMMSTFEDTWNEAIQQLIIWGGVFIGEDETGKRYLAHKTPQMDMACTVTVKARESWDAWRKQLFALLTVIGSVIALRRNRAQNAKENDRVAVLAQSALNLLRNQELAHYTDPITAPHPYLPSLQLRDLILQDEPSTSSRRRLWAKVERIVEENTNVRTNLEEVEGGNEERVWRWVGSAGRSLPQATESPAA